MNRPRLVLTQTLFRTPRSERHCIASPMNTTGSQPALGKADISLR
jgi:hypothetical protein